MHSFFLKVKAVVLDPDNGFSVDRTLTKNDVEKLIKVSIQYILQVNIESKVKNKNKSD